MIKLIISNNLFRGTDSTFSRALWILAYGGHRRGSVLWPGRPLDAPTPRGTCRHRWGGDARWARATGPSRYPALPSPSSAAPRDMPSLFWFSDDIYHSKGTSVAGRPPLIYYKAISVPISKCIGTKMCDVHHTIKVYLKVIWNYDYGHGEVQRLTRAEISEKRSPVPFSLWKSHTFNYFYHYWGNLSFTCGSSDLNELDSVTRYNA